MDEVTAHVGSFVVENDTPPVIERDLDDLSAEALDRLELGPRSVLGDHHPGGDSPRPRHPRHPLGHVSRARGIDPFTECIWIGHGNGVAGAA